MLDNFFEDSYHSYDKIYEHPETHTFIYLGDMQAALDDDFLHNKNIKTGTLIIIQSSLQPKTWIIQSSIQPFSTQFTHFSTANNKVSDISLTPSLTSSNKIFNQAAFSFTVLLASPEYKLNYIEFNSGDFLSDEKGEKNL